MTILQRIESAAADIILNAQRLQVEEVQSDASVTTDMLSAFDDLQAAMIEYQTGQAPTPLPARTPLTDAWTTEAPRAYCNICKLFGYPGDYSRCEHDGRPENNDGVSDEIPDSTPRGSFSDDLHERDIGPRD